MFGPDGLGTQALLWLLALGAVVAFAVLGHRIGGKSTKHALARLGSLFAAALVAVLAVTATLNSRYGWYSSWTDMYSSLTGAPIHGTTQQFGADPQSDKGGAHARDTKRDKAVDAEADRKYKRERALFAANIPRPQPGQPGVWFKVNVPGIPVKGRDIGRMMIWLPKAYFTQPQRTFPVIQAFHGIPGGTLDYERVFGLHNFVSKAASERKMADSIIIVPQEMPAGIDTECVDGGGLKMETWLTQNVPNWTIQNLRVKAAATSWMALGVSAGGWCASMAGLLHPERYAGIASLGGYFSPQFDAWNPFTKTGVPERYDLIKYVGKNPHPQDMWILISGADKVSQQSTQAFVKAVKPPIALTTMTYPNAGHRTDVWIQALPSVMEWAGQVLPGFSPSVK